MPNIEIEIQVKIEDSAPLLEFLEAKGDFIGEKRQLDEYFNPAHRDFCSVRPMPEWLRLRDANGKYSINYKNWHFDADGRSHYCDEYETKVEDIEKMRKIFLALNFKQIVAVDKIRKIWNYKDYEVAVDFIKGLGDFVEIEYKGDDKNAIPDKITAGMIEWLKSLGCGKIERGYQGYPFVLLFPEEAKYEEQ